MSRVDDSSETHLCRDSSMLSSLGSSSSCSSGAAAWCSSGSRGCRRLAGSSSACLLCLAGGSNRCLPGQLWSSQDLKRFQDACDGLSCLHSTKRIVA